MIFLSIEYISIIIQCIGIVKKKMPLYSDTDTAARRELKIILLPNEDYGVHWGCLKGVRGIFREEMERLMEAFHLCLL